MPELPEMTALGERLADLLVGARVSSVDVLGFSSLKTVLPDRGLVGARLEGVFSRAKYVVFDFTGDLRTVLHLGQAGRVDFESPAKTTRPRTSIVRFCFDDSNGLLVREFGRERRAGWWVLAGADAGPLATLGPQPGDQAFDERLRNASDTRHLHTALRDQHFVSGLGRGYTDDILNRAQLSPFTSLSSLDDPSRERLVSAVHAVLEEALLRERTRTGGLSNARLGERFAVHNRAGLDCPACGQTLQRVSYATYEIVYCPSCQTGGRALADRRLSRLLR